MDLSQNRRLVLGLQNWWTTKRWRPDLTVERTLSAMAEFGEERDQEW